MTRYLLGRIVRGILSAFVVVAVVMVMIYSFLDKQSIFANDPAFAKQKSNAKQVYQMQEWERYGYLEYIPYGDYVQQQVNEGKIRPEEFESYAKIGDTPSRDNPQAGQAIREFTAHYESLGYTVTRLPADTMGNTNKYKEGGAPRLYAHRDIPLTTRLYRYLTGLITVDHIHAVQEDVGERGLSFTLYDPIYGGERFSPAIMGNGTRHKYLLYCDHRFPFVHQNLVQVNLGISYSVNKGVDVFDTMTAGQGDFDKRTVTYPTGVTEETADDLHSAVYVPNSLETNPMNKKYFVDNYTGVTTAKKGLSQLGYSFSIGVLAVLLTYAIAIPFGIAMARHKEKLTDKLGTFYIIFIMAVPSLGYIFLFKSLGAALGLPVTFDMQNPTWVMYVLPIVSLALPSIANLLKWLRRYMIDQMGSDYVKFARSSGISEKEIFSRHILKNAAIPVVHGIPAGVLGALTGAIITERVYLVPGVGNLLTNAINGYDNGVIVGVTLFYALLSVTATILGDVLLSVADPRISFGTKGR